MSNDLCSLISSFFLNPSFITKVNHTLISLIPKIENRTHISHFRLISICNVSYKVLTKAIAYRLKGVIKVLISPIQCSFVPHL